MASFTITPLAAHRAFIEGTDFRGTQGSTILSTGEWNAFKELKAHHEAHETFDNAVEKFFSPLTKAAQALEITHHKGATELDPAQVIVLQEPVEAVEGDPGVRVVLGFEATILRLIEEGDFSRLIWVNGELELLAEAPATAKKRKK